MKRLFTGLLIVILILTTVGWTSQPTEQQSVQVPGLKEPAEILVDKWGVPHIYAKNQEDAFSVQRFNAARDRLWQFDLWRKRGFGQLSEVLGPSYVNQDHVALHG